MLHTGRVLVNTRGHADMHDLTPQAEHIVAESGVHAGTSSRRSPCRPRSALHHNDPWVTLAESDFRKRPQDGNLQVTLGKCHPPEGTR